MCIICILYLKYAIVMWKISVLYCINILLSKYLCNIEKKFCSRDIPGNKGSI